MGGNDCTWTPLLYWLHTIFRGWRRQKWMSQILHPTSGNIVLGPMRMPHTTNPVPLPAYPFRGFSRWVSHQYFWVSENMRKNPLCKKTKNKMIMDWREDQFCQQLSTLSPLPLLGQTITISELGNQYFSLMLPHNACKGWCGSVWKIGINFAPVESVNAKTSHGPECGWLTGCQPWLYYWLKPLWPHPPQQQAAIATSHHCIDGDN